MTCWFAMLPFNNGRGDGPYLKGVRLYYLTYIERDGDGWPILDNDNDVDTLADADLPKSKTTPDGQGAFRLDLRDVI
ncbi:hypothetical protein C8034_v004424 [Colletotrichum sidae]|uniref:Uncharacterized protein n=1 Tax=Colletotrichum sidae TaxID=1347389 RepID=A0A4R8T828_9PEZI|nr:hypothetical protein C8034_v004424 [Colletotrichum sidae]